MFSIRRNQIIIAALVVMIGVAGYLSYIDRSPSSGEFADDGLLLTRGGEVSALIYDSTIGQEIPVVSLNKTSEIDPGLLLDEEILISTDAQEELPGEAVFVSKTDDVQFFVQEKLDREQGRSKQREMLMDMINSTNVEKDKKGECADKLLEIQNRIEKETSAEAMIEAKGFGECYVRIDDETVDVVVTKKQLSDSEIAQIEDIVKRKTGMGVEKIRISSLVK